MDMTSTLSNYSGPIAVCPNQIVYVMIAAFVAVVIAFVGLALSKS